MQKEWHGFLELNEPLKYNPDSQKYETCMVIDKFPLFIEEYAKRGNIIYDLSAFDPNLEDRTLFATIRLKDWGIKRTKIKQSLYKMIERKCKEFTSLNDVTK